MASSTVARSRQRAALDSEDAMALRAAEIAAWARRNARVIITVSAVVLVAAAGFVFWRVSQAQKEARAAEQFLSLRANPTVATAAGAGQIDQFIKNNDGTVEADEARLLLGEVRLNNGQARQAADGIRPLAEGSSPLAAQGGMLLGAALAQAGDRAGAAKAFEAAAAKARQPYQKVEALGQAALMYEQGNDFAAAAKIYESMLADAEDGSAQQTVLQMRLAEARARAAAR